MKQAFALLALVFVPNLCAASIVTYSWSGNMIPSAGGDPFALGSTKPYSVSISLDTAAVDQNASVEFAQFSVTDLKVFISGVQATTFQKGNLRFRDNDFGGSWDTLTLANAKITFNGVTAFFNTFAALPDETTFTFTQANETVPVFTTRDASGAIGADGYTVSATSQINVSSGGEVPEPAAFTIWSFGALGCAVAAYRRRKLAA